jgi:hypothetical protein
LIDPVVMSTVVILRQLIRATISVCIKAMRESPKQLALAGQKSSSVQTGGSRYLLTPPSARPVIEKVNATVNVVADADLNTLEL